MFVRLGREPHLREGSVSGLIGQLEPWRRSSISSAKRKAKIAGSPAPDRQGYGPRLGVSKPPPTAELADAR